MTEWERARTREQRESREKEILKAAGELLIGQSYESISLSNISDCISFSRASIYKYFQSKEEVYLSLLSDKILEFSNHIYENLHPDPLSIHPLFIQFSESWSLSIEKEKVLLQLLSMAGTILEKNCSNEILLRSKRSMNYSLETYLVPVLIRYFPDRSVEFYKNTLQTLVILANGLYPFCGLSPEQKKLLKENGLDSLIHDFSVDYKTLLINYFSKF